MVLQSKLCQLRARTHDLRVRVAPVRLPHGLGDVAYDRDDTGALSVDILLAASCGGHLPHAKRNGVVEEHMRNEPRRQVERRRGPHDEQVAQHAVRNVSRAGDDACRQRCSLSHPQRTNEERPAKLESAKVEPLVEVVRTPADLAQDLLLLLREARGKVALGSAMPTITAYLDALALALRIDNVRVVRVVGLEPCLDLRACPLLRRRRERAKSGARGMSGKNVPWPQPLRLRSCWWW